MHRDLRISTYFSSYGNIKHSSLTFFYYILSNILIQARIFIYKKYANRTQLGCTLMVKAYLTSLLDGVDLALISGRHHEGDSVVNFQLFELGLGQVSAPCVEKSSGQFGIF